MEFSELNVELGYTYDSAAIVGDEPRTTTDRRHSDLRALDPAGRALPHAWIDDELGGRRPIKDLVDPGPSCDRRRAGPGLVRRRGSSRPDTASRSTPCASATSTATCTTRVCAWIRLRQITAEGAILVRPDRHVAWRNVGAAAAPAEDLERALGRCSRGRSAATPLA